MLFKEFRLEGQSGDTRSPFTIKTILEYTPGDINQRGNWMTDKAANADTLTVENGDFDKALRSSKIITLAVPEHAMKINPYKEKQFIQKYKILWFNNPSKDADDIFRMTVFHHVEIKRVTRKVFRGFEHANYYEVVMLIKANIDYLDKFGTRAGS